jgi:hypothetical protein
MKGLLTLAPGALERTRKRRALGKVTAGTWLCVELLAAISDTPQVTAGHFCDLLEETLDAFGGDADVAAQAIRDRKWAIGEKPTMN